jgi:hypothetical protein
MAKISKKLHDAYGAGNIQPIVALVMIKDVLSWGLPTWAEKALLDHISRKANLPATKRKNADEYTHLRRYLKVRKLLEDGAKWTDEAVFEEAAEELRRDFGDGGGKDAIRRSYMRIARRARRKAELG